MFVDEEICPEYETYKFTTKTHPEFLHVLHWVLAARDHLSEMPVGYRVLHSSPPILICANGFTVHQVLLGGLEKWLPEGNYMSRRATHRYVECVPVYPKERYALPNDEWDRIPNGRSYPKQVNLPEGFEHIRDVSSLVYMTSVAIGLQRFRSKIVVYDHSALALSLSLAHQNIRAYEDCLYGSGSSTEDGPQCEFWMRGNLIEERRKQPIRSDNFDSFV